MSPNIISLGIRWEMFLVESLTLPFDAQYAVLQFRDIYNGIALTCKGPRSPTNNSAMSYFVLIVDYLSETMLVQNLSYKNWPV